MMYYWLARAVGGFALNSFDPWEERMYVSDNANLAFGVRVLITLPDTVKVSEESVGTKTITGRNSADYTYNIWNIN
mgnify:CR=1 FL=1